MACGRAGADPSWSTLQQKTKIAGLLALLGAAALFLYRCDPRPSGAAGEKSDTATETEQKTQARSENDTAPRPSFEATRGMMEDASQLLQQAFSELSAVPADEERARRVLEKTTTELLGRPGRTAAAAILQALESGQDAETGLPFRPGEDGLESWPTWRVYLLDLLGSIHPKLAADYARREVFTGYASSDEWAIAMRGVWAATPQDRQAQAQGELSDLIQRMLGYEAWRAQPSDGMLEAMDFVTLAAEPSRHLAVLHEWAAGTRDGRVDTAVQIAAERAVLRQGDRLLTALAADPGMWATAPAHRASIMARADLRQPAQAAAVRAYLGRLGPGSREAEAFFALFPNHRFSVMPGLAGWPPVPAAGEMRAADAAAREVLAAWSNEAGLAAHAGSLTSLQEKLGRMLQGP